MNVRRPTGYHVLLAALLLLSTGCGRQPPPPPSPTGPDTQAETLVAFDSLDAALRRTRARFERLPPPTSDEEYALRRPRTPPYSRHLETAEEVGVEPVTGEDAIAAHLAAGELVPLVDTDTYVVQVLEHSAPFVTPALKTFLDDLGRRFQDKLAERGLPRYRFMITSALRTAGLQSDLRESNRNATSGSSTHEFGVSVDIVNFRYVYRPSPSDSLALQPSAVARRLDAIQDETYRAYGGFYWDHLFGLMTRLLAERQRRGDVLVLLEAEQPVFHLTVTRRLAA